MTMSQLVTCVFLTVGGSPSPPPSTSAPGAIGGPAVDFPETTSLFNTFNPAMYGE